MADQLPPPEDGRTHTAEPALSMKDKILKRAELSRITRLLKSRLEIAQFKVGRSWQNLPFKSVEPQLEREAKLNRDSPDAFDPHIPSSPPPHGMFLVPELPVRVPMRNYEQSPGRTYPQTMTTSTTALTGLGSAPDLGPPRISPLKRRRSNSSERYSPGPEDSPLKHRISTPNMKHSVLRASAHISPHPSTPPPSHRTLTNGPQSFKQDAEEGADLLLYLATSPSPAKPRKINRPLEFSSPPPMRGSSAVNTPIGAGFNLSEFLNFTPSPAQAQAQAHAQRNRFEGHKFSPTKLTYEKHDHSPSSIVQAKQVDFGREMNYMR